MHTFAEKYSNKNDNTVENSRFPVNNSLNHSFSSIVHKKKNIEVQFKLSINSPGDIYEQEADAMADKIMRMENPVSGSDEISSGNPVIQRKQTGNEASAESLSSVNDVINSSSGKPLDSGTRAFMEPRFGHDFSKVKIHTDERASESARAINALAYTVGNNVVFSNGQYSPGTGKGQSLLAHELTHVVQQGSSVQKIQRFVPEDAAEEMKSRKFKLNINLNATLKGVKTAIPSGTIITITKWENTSRTVEGNITLGTTVHLISVNKKYLTPIGDTTTGLYQYSAGVSGKETDINTADTKIEDLKKEKPAYDKAKNTAGYTAELSRLEGLQEKRYTTLNAMLIQETMFNTFDAVIKKWVDYYNKAIGKPKKWTDLDANIVKSILYQESQMGTLGDFLPTSPPASYPGSLIMTRFNITQSIDSSGPILIIMMNENDKSSPSIDSRFHYNDVSTDFSKAYTAVAKEKEGKKLSSAEQLSKDEADKRTLFVVGGKTKRLWNMFYISDKRFEDSVTEFMKQTSTPRQNSYEFWIQAAIRWLFEKRESTKDWAGAIQAYNGEGTKAEQYKKSVIGRRDAAKSASSEFIPKRTY